MKNTFPGFPYPASRIRKYFYNLNFFMFQLDTGELFSFTAENKDSLLTWLQKNHVPFVGDMAE